MRILNTVYVTDHRARVTVKQKSIEIRHGKDLVARYPMAGTEAIVLASAANITTEATGRCLRNGIHISSLHTSGSVRYVVRGPTSGNVQLRQSQYRMSENPSETNELSRCFVAGKLQNQRRLISRWIDSSSDPVRTNMEIIRADIGVRIGSLANAQTGDMIRGIEGDSTRRYFKALGAHLDAHAPEFVFIRRSRRPPRDPFNALMSFVYGLLVVSTVGALDAVGLDPQIGYLHRARPGRPSLALDLVEEFRSSIADRFIVSCLTRRQIGPEDFASAGDAWYLSDEGRKKLIGLYEAHRSEQVRHPLLNEDVPRSLLPNIQATLLARHIRGDIPSYPPYLLER